MEVSSADVRLGRVNPRELTAARLQLHHAVQIVSAVGHTLLEPRADDSHTNLEWRADVGALVSNEIPGERPCRAGLRFSDLSLLVIGSEGAADGSDLAGKSIEEGLAWLELAISSYMLKDLPKPLERAPLDIPRHPVADGATFSLDPPEAFEELARWYAVADSELRTLSAAALRATPVRCWPHHFDIAFLMELDRGRDVERPRTIGVGMSPGDESCPEPYFYVGPYPYPEEPRLPPLEGAGEWQTEGWLGALLTGSALVPDEDGARQRQRIRVFARSAIEACRGLLGYPEPVLRL